MRAMRSARPATPPTALLTTTVVPLSDAVSSTVDVAMADGAETLKLVMVDTEAGSATAPAPLDGEGVAEGIEKVIEEAFKP